MNRGGGTASKNSTLKYWHKKQNTQAQRQPECFSHEEFSQQEGSICGFHILEEHQHFLS
jgi:hypothetical protein